MKDTWHARRFNFLLSVVVLIFFVLIVRILYLNVFDKHFLQHQSYIRSVRLEKIPAHRGMILDRNQVPLAISSAVESIWVNLRILTATHSQLWHLAKLLHLPYASILHKAKDRSRWFVYLKRRVNPELADEIKNLDISGIFFEREFQRFYPDAEVTSHVLGFTNIDDKGQEGLELAYNSWLEGETGLRRVLKDRLGHVIANLETIKRPIAGHNLILSLDARIQYLAFQVLKKTVKKYHAASGSIVVLNCHTGEVLAMVNQPAFNPNDKKNADESSYRNRAVTDQFEPGSTMKAFSIISALDSGKYTPDTKIDTNPGWMVVGGNTINDEHVNHGVITVTQVLQKSSNVGAAKMTLSLPPEQLWNLLYRFGFGERTTSGFPGEASGSLVDHRVWRPFVLATLAFGYGVSATTLQLARAYAIIANDGKKVPITFLKLNKTPDSTAVITPKVAHEMLHMLTSVVKAGGTGGKARLSNYTVAGKTGTAYIASPKGGYDKHKYIGSFVGIAPVSNPQLVVAVVIREPKGQHFGGLVAAPAFAKVMGGALRFLNVIPDKM
ncbi:MAG: penicillin-binding protein 2 [Gammaproteobacteria bacterium]|nr:penicillin-binding protein 2 [Gammaproteobacteria bacterium]